MIQSSSNQTILPQLPNQTSSQVPSNNPTYSYPHSNLPHSNPTYLTQPIHQNRQCGIHPSQQQSFHCQYPIVQNPAHQSNQSYPSNQISAPQSSSTYNQTQYNYPTIPPSQQIQSQTNNMPYVVIQNPQLSQQQPQIQQTYNYQSPPPPPQQLIHPIQQEQHNSLTKNFEQQSCFNISNSPSSMSLNNNVNSSLAVPSPSSLSNSSSSVNTNNTLQYSLSQPFSSMSVGTQPNQQVCLLSI